MRTILLYGLLGALGMVPVWLVLSVWNDEPHTTTPTVAGSAEEQARLDAEAARFVLNRDGCELALRQVIQVVARQKRGAKMGLERCQVDGAKPPEENVARGRAKFLGALQWDPPVDFSVWFVRTERGGFTACAVQVDATGPQPASARHNACPDWRGRT